MTAPKIRVLDVMWGVTVNYTGSKRASKTAKAKAVAESSIVSIPATVLQGSKIGSCD